MLNSAELGPDHGGIALILRHKRLRGSLSPRIAVSRPGKSSSRLPFRGGFWLSGSPKMLIPEWFFSFRSPGQIPCRDRHRHANLHTGEGLPNACMIGKSLAIWMLGQDHCPNFRVYSGTAFAAPVIFAGRSAAGNGARELHFRKQGS